MDKKDLQRRAELLKKLAIGTGEQFKEIKEEITGEAETARKKKELQTAKGRLKNRLQEGAVQKGYTPQQAGEISDYQMEQMKERPGEAIPLMIAGEPDVPERDRPFPENIKRQTIWESPRYYTTRELDPETQEITTKEYAGDAAKPVSVKRVPRSQLLKELPMPVKTRKKK